MDEWEVTDEAMDAYLEEWREVDREAAAYLAERVPGLTDPVSDRDGRWLDAVIETFSPTDEPPSPDTMVELFSSVMALQHADWLALALGAVRRGAGSALDAEQVIDDVDELDEVEGEVEDPDGTRDVLESALLALAPAWEELGVLDAHERFTARGVWGLPRALYRNWTRD